jgi:hypothetical protein
MAVFSLGCDFGTYNKRAGQRLEELRQMPQEQTDNDEVPAE